MDSELLCMIQGAMAAGNVVAIDDIPLGVDIDALVDAGYIEYIGNESAVRLTEYGAERFAGIECGSYWWMWVAGGGLLGAMLVLWFFYTKPVEALVETSSTSATAEKEEILWKEIEQLSKNLGSYKSTAPKWIQINSLVDEYIKAEYTQHREQVDALLRRLIPYRKRKFNIGNLTVGLNLLTSGQKDSFGEALEAVTRRDGISQVYEYTPLEFSDIGFQLQPSLSLNIWPIEESGRPGSALSIMAPVKMDKWELKGNQLIFTWKGGVGTLPAEHDLRLYSRWRILAHIVFNPKDKKGNTVTRSLMVVAEFSPTKLLQWGVVPDLLVKLPEGKDTEIMSLVVGRHSE